MCTSFPAYDPDARWDDASAEGDGSATQGETTEAVSREAVDWAPAFTASEVLHDAFATADVISLEALRATVEGLIIREVGPDSQLDPGHVKIATIRALLMLERAFAAARDPFRAPGHPPIIRLLDPALLDMSKDKLYERFSAASG